MSVFSFKLSSTPAHSDPLLSTASSPISAPIFKVPEYDPGYATATTELSLPPPSSRYTTGSFEYDEVNDYTLQWSSFADMHTWLRLEEKRHTIEFRRKEIRRNKGADKVWAEKHIYVCARKGSGGKKTYQKKYSWTRKIPTKRIDCDCRLTVKTYPGTETILGMYQPEHCHPIGNENTCFTRLPDKTRAEIERLLRLGVEPKAVV
jgi:hypothetical protein